ncbi:MAG: tetratricopeptide repeat protein [Planctomycetes bacterium]|nr:tetratricopeptide repeat protein [Planctomycetota bacterium]
MERQTNPSGRRPRFRPATVAAAVAGATLAAVVMRWWPQADAAAPAAASYVGRASCAECHAAEVEAYAGSQHDLAMQPPTAQTVLGDFGGSTFTHFGVTTTFSRKEDQFLVRTDGPDGQLHDYPVQYVFGVTPLQQYLLDIGGGRLQALTIAWDSRPAEAGGQRWFHLYPNERLPAGDELHWTGIQQNWNFMCAECHSTDLRRGYDAPADRFHTTWAELDVSCESCHGPASQHVAWAKGDPTAAALGEAPGKGLLVSLDERRGVTWRRDDTTHKPVRSAPRTTQKELDTCARCHSRRTVFDEDFVPGRPLLDTHLPALLTAPLYHADGQMRDEVYNYQSFLQSRMAQHGVTCSDCHEPHTGKTRAPGNMVCMQCHEASFDTPQHHFHAAGSAGAQCTACHMPTTTYMGVDPRHDHGFKIPRPDLAARFGVPDACSGCHTDKSPAWAAEKLKEQHGRLRTERYPWTEAFAAARDHRADAELLLLRIAGDAEQPAIVRATALDELPRPLQASSLGAVLDALRDSDPLLRWTAAELLVDAPAEAHAPLQTLLHDPVRAVRMTAARGLVGHEDHLGQDDLAAQRAGLAEYVAAQHTNDDRPETHLNLGNLALEQNDFVAAEREYRAALRLHPQFVPAYVNLADLQRARGQDAECERTLRDGIAVAPQNGELQHALGLCLIRSKRLPEAIVALGTAATAAPDHPRYAYVHAIALQTAGRLDEAIAALQAATQRSPDDPGLTELLVDYLVQQGDVSQARSRAAQYQAKWPDSQAVQRWRQDLLR